MSRYVERAENVARFISVNLNLSLDMPGEAGQQWWPLVIITGDQAEFQKRALPTTKESVIQFLTFDKDNPNSILSCLRSARENARGVREIISAEMWEHINKFYLSIRDGGSLEEILDNPYAFFERVSVSGQQFLGVTDATMTHGEAWHFCQMGRMLERADKTSRLLDVKYFILLPKVSDVGTPFDDIQWLALLRSASALEMYRQRHGRICAGERRQFPGARSRVSASRAPLPNAGERIAPLDFRHAHRRLLQIWPNAAWGNCGGISLHAGRRCNRRRPARIRRQFANAAQHASANQFTIHFSQCVPSKRLERDVS